MPEMIDTFMYALMKEAMRNSLVDWLEEWDIAPEQFQEIEEWFWNTHKIKLV